MRGDNLFSPFCCVRNNWASVVSETIAFLLCQKQLCFCCVGNNCASVVSETTVLLLCRKQLCFRCIGNNCVSVVSETIVLLLCQKQLCFCCLRSQFRFRCVENNCALLCHKQLCFCWNWKMVLGRRNVTISTWILESNSRRTFPLIVYNNETEYVDRIILTFSRYGDK